MDLGDATNLKTLNQIQCASATCLVATHTAIRQLFFKGKFSMSHEQSQTEAERAIAEEL